MFKVRPLVTFISLAFLILQTPLFAENPNVTTQTKTDNHITVQLSSEKETTAHQPVSTADNVKNLLAHWKDEDTNSTRKLEEFERENGYLCGGLNGTQRLEAGRRVLKKNAYLKNILAEIKSPNKEQLFLTPYFQINGIEFKGNLGNGKSISLKFINDTRFEGYYNSFSKELQDLVFFVSPSAQTPKLPNNELRLGSLISFKNDPDKLELHYAAATTNRTYTPIKVIATIQ